MQYRAVRGVLIQLAQRFRRHWGRQRRSSGGKVLVVHGSRMAAELAEILRRQGLSIHLIEQAALLEQVRRTQPALVVSDLSIGGLSGMEDAIRLRQLLPTCKVLLFSGQGLRRTSLPRDSETELVRTIERLCSQPQSGQVLWLDLARFIQVTPRQKSMAA